MKHLRIFTTLVLVCGIAATSHGAWIFAKARLAQFLLREAWQRTMAGQQHARPWPWADTSPIAQLTIARDGSTFIVLGGASGRNLAFAPGHVDDTAMPGDDGNCVISAHRDTHFSVLRDLAAGDHLAMQRRDGTWVDYVVRETRIVDKNETWIAAPRGEPLLTLITCWPFDAIVPGGPQRYVVIAKRSDPPTPAGESRTARRRDIRPTFSPPRA